MKGEEGKEKGEKERKKGQGEDERLGGQEEEEIKGTHKEEQQLKEMEEIRDEELGKHEDNIVGLLDTSARGQIFLGHKLMKLKSKMFHRSTFNGHAR